MTAKQLQRQAKKCELEAKKEQKKVKKAVDSGDIDGARIYAQNAIRQKNERLNLLKLASRIEAAAARVETAYRMQSVTKEMANVVKNMDKAMKSMDLVKMTQVMDQFDKQFEDVDVVTTVMEEKIASGTALSTPQDEVDALIQGVAEQSGVELAHELDDVPTTAPGEEEEEEELDKRLTKLRVAA